MKRFTLGSMAVAMLVSSFALGLLCGSTASADMFSNDFTKDMGNWKLDKAEGKIEKDGLVITKFEQFGGIGIEVPSAKAEDISNAKAVTIDLQNAGDSELSLAFKIGSGKDKKTKEIKIAAGKSMTFTYPLADSIDLKKVDYMKLFAGQETQGKLIIKKLTIVMKGQAASASKPAETKPADTKPTSATGKASLENSEMLLMAAVNDKPATATASAPATKTAAAPSTASAPAVSNAYTIDFTKDMGKWKLDKAEGKQVAGEGLKITDMTKLGGPMMEGPKVDVSANPYIVFEIDNAKEALKMSLKVKSGAAADEKKATVDNVAVGKGKVTVKVNLKNTDIDLKALSYVKLMGNGECDLTIKSISFSATK